MMATKLRPINSDLDAQIAELSAIRRGEREVD